MSKLRPSGVVDKSGKPTEPVLKLLDLLRLPHDGSLSSVVAVTQEKFIQRKESGEQKERWELTDSNEYVALREKVMPLLDKLGMLQEVKLKGRRRSFMYALLLGALVTRVRSRLKYLIELCKHGVRFDTLVLLGGQRPLESSAKETKAILFDSNNAELPFSSDWQPPPELALPTTELEMMMLVWSQSEASLPRDMAHVVVLPINAPMKENISGPPQRPSTEDTINQFLSLHSTTQRAHSIRPGPVLAVSNQPHVGYQYSILKTLMPPDFPVTIIGHEASRTLPLAYYLGELARWLYQEQKQAQTGGNPPSS